MRSLCLPSICLLGLSLGVCLPTPAQAWPEKPVHIVVTFPPGGTTDIIARELAHKLKPRWNVPVLVENRPGGGGSIGATEVARDRPDGYTLLFGTSGTQSINQFLYKNISYDPERDFSPITLLGSVPNIFLLHPSVTAATAEDFIKLVRAHPGKYSFASSGLGTPQHLTAEILRRSEKLDMLHVPYSGAAPGVAALLGGHVSSMFPSLPSAGIVDHVQSGRLRALAVTGSRRVHALPEIPTVEEIGLPQLQVVTWYGLLAPAGTPKATLSKINEAVRSVLDDPDVRTRLQRSGVDVETSTPEAFAAFIASETARWKTVVHDANITLD